MFGFKFLGNTHVPHHKNTAEMQGVAMTPPKEVLLLTAQHIGAPASPIVKVGDEVRVGQKVAEAQGPVSSPVYSSVSGKVTKLDSYMSASGRTIPAIRIASDGLMTPVEDLTPPTVTDLDSLVDAVRESGIVGLGGAGFPTAIKLCGAKNGNIDTVILNGAECEPYITCDTRTMLEDGELIKEGIALLRSVLPTVKSYIIGIEGNKPDCIANMKATFDGENDVTVFTLPDAYPQGAEKVIIYNTTRRVVPEGKLPGDVGVMVINVTTLAELARYVKTGMPLVQRCVTVDGSAVLEPKNIIVPIGTSLREIADFVGLKEQPGKVIFGGPMMGTPACSMDDPTTKTTGGITILSVSDSLSKAPTGCIHCGRCVSACPISLNPTAFAKALELESKEDRLQRLEDEKIMLCMECGCCSFVCPANRPLIQNNRLAKGELRDYKAHMAKLK
ncbi:MAG: electron transport complex subunit RsxC [Clostridia bacterium]|nr:electron transport complex subunit RsxC [Clostridia bacterium]